METILRGCRLDMKETHPSLQLPQVVDNIHYLKHSSRYYQIQDLSTSIHLGVPFLQLLGHCVSSFQEEQTGKKLRNVATFEASQKILHLAQQDTTLRCRLAGVNDLIASEGNYHLHTKRAMEKMQI